MEVTFKSKYSRGVLWTASKSTDLPPRFCYQSGLLTGTLYLMHRWVMTVERQHRLRFPAEAVTAISWLARSIQNVEVKAIPGLFGELRALPPGSTAEERHASLSVAFENASRENEILSDEVLRLARYFSDSVLLKFSKEKGHTTLVLPRDARGLGFVPRKGEHAVVFVFGEILEIWTEGAWREQSRRAAEEYEELMEQAENQLLISGKK